MLLAIPVAFDLAFDVDISRAYDIRCNKKAKPFAKEMKNATFHWGFSCNVSRDR
jgi:hypothetical protein